MKGIKKIRNKVHLELNVIIRPGVGYGGTILEDDQGRSIEDVAGSGEEDPLHGQILNIVHVRKVLCARGKPQLKVGLEGRGNPARPIAALGPETVDPSRPGMDGR